MVYKHFFLFLFVFFLLGTGVFARSVTEQPDEIATFRFVAGKDMLYVPWNGNGGELERLYKLVDEYHAEIVAGHMPVYVDGYCASLSTRRENLHVAFIRANRVKSELIVHKGLLEKHFITKNYADSYQGFKDVVIVTLRIPVKKEEPTPEVYTQPEPVKESVPVVEAQPEPEPVVVTEVKTPDVFFPPFALRTNLLYDLFLTPTLGIEWRINADVGIKLDGSWAHWGNEHGKVQKLWLISPEVRWYMGEPKRFYVGAGANVGEFNLYKYMVGSFFPAHTGYQGNLYSGGVTVGYQLPIGSRFGIDFNLGLGYTRLKYDSFYLSNEVRVYRDRDRIKNFWGAYTGRYFIYLVSV